MKKYLLLLAGVMLFAMALSGREWLLLEEISATQNQIREQLPASIKLAPNVERVHYLGNSSVVFERYLEPVLDVTSRMLWAPFRSSVITDWKREIHAKIDDLSAARIAELTGQTEKEIAKIKIDSKPSLNRLFEILKVSENNSTPATCSQAVQEEMKLVKEAGLKRDQEVLASLKAEGISQLKHLEKLLKGMSQAEIEQFLKSGRFVREIEQPVLDFVFQLKQEELRRAAWDEFEKKLEATLSKKVPMAKIKDRSLRAQKEIERLFNSMTEAKGQELQAIPPQNPMPIAPDSKLIIPEARVPSSPSDAGSRDDSEGDLQSPADADAAD
jgi:hypothetical protein